MAIHDWLNWGLQIWLALMVATVVVKMLQGDIALTETMAHEHQGGYAPERAQLFLASIAAVAYYAFQGFSLLGTGATSLPDVDDTVVTLLAGSNGIYLFGKHTFANRRPL